MAMTDGRYEKRNNSDHPARSSMSTSNVPSFRSTVQTRDRRHRHRQPVVTIRNCLVVSSHCSLKGRGLSAGSTIARS
jgi:hypothetical protein